MAAPTSVAPILSTPDTHIAESPANILISRPNRADAQLSQIYEVERTVSEIRAQKWRRIALQFPDSLLPDAPRIYELLSERLPRKLNTASKATHDPKASEAEETIEDEEPLALYILADTSYGSCCADEIAAEHVDADVVVHYGRACLSPAARLPVIHVFTAEDLELAAVTKAFGKTYTDHSSKIILMADAPYQCHITSLYKALKAEGYANIFATSMIHDPSSPLPNRTTPEADSSLRDWHLFHVSSPPPALLLTLASRVASIHFYPTDSLSLSSSTQPSALQAQTTQALRRRYALITRVSRASIIGILVNTLSVHSYQDALRGTQALIAAAGKKSYVFAMGRPNPAKVANFAEVDGWVVLGCWESSLIESTEFDKPLLAPFELEIALKSDEERIWTGEWRGDFGSVAEAVAMGATDTASIQESDGINGDVIRDESGFDGTEENVGSESESEPPEYDLRTGRYVQHSKPMRKSTTGNKINGANRHTALARRAKGDLAVIGGELSPGAQFLQDKRTWRGLGSDFEIAYEEDGAAGGLIKEGRSGIARGYEGEKQNGQEST